MAVLNRDDFFSAIQSIIKDDTSDDSITFVENMTDTYNSLVDSANSDGVHPNELGHAVLASKFKGFLETLLL